MGIFPGRRRRLEKLEARLRCALAVGLFSFLLFCYAARTIVGIALKAWGK